MLKAYIFVSSASSSHSTDSIDFAHTYCGFYVIFHPMKYAMNSLQFVFRLNVAMLALKDHSRSFVNAIRSIVLGRSDKLTFRRVIHFDACDMLVMR